MNAERRGSEEKKIATALLTVLVFLSVQIRGYPRLSAANSAPA